MNKSKSGQVLVNGQVKKAKYTVQEGDIVTYYVPEPEVLEYVAEDLPLEIIYQDEDVAVVNKPQGMVVHPSAGHTSGTLVNALMYHIKDLSGINGVLRPGIVHRIDKDTSGLLMIAKMMRRTMTLAQELRIKSLSANIGRLFMEICPMIVVSLKRRLAGVKRP